MKLNEMYDREIILVCGNLCSGKGHFCQTNYPGYEQIEISRIVKSLINSSDRSKLAKTAYLDKRIIEIVIEQVNNYEKVVVDGIRQLSILKALEEHYGNQIKDVIWLDVPMNTLKDRYEKRASAKDKNMSFDDAFQSDQEMGIGDVEGYIRQKHKVIPHE